MSTLSHWLHLPDRASDAEILSQMRRALREAETSAALVIAGSFAGDATDAKAHGELVSLVLDAPIPVFASAIGSVGQRGLALLLAADRAVLAPETQVPREWRASPGLVSLLLHRLGPTAASAALFDPSSDILAHLVEHGHATRTKDPDSHIRESAAALGNGLGSRLKRTLKASSELPLKEAISFDLWFSRPGHVSAP